MSLDLVREQIDTLRSIIEMLDRDADAEDLPTEAVEEFSRAVDATRAHLWAVLMDRQGDRTAQYLARMRVRRATEICEQVLAELYAGTIAGNVVGLPLFHASLGELAGALARVRS